MQIDLDADGLTGQWVAVEDVGKKSPKQFRTLTGLPKTETELTALSEEEATDAARTFIRMVVSSWYVLNPETGAALPAPNSTTLDPNDIPMVVTGRIRAEVWGRIEEIQSLKAKSRNG